MAEVKLNSGGGSGGGVGSSVHNPDSLYAQCLKSIVANTNNSVPSMDRVYQLRFLPQHLLIDVYEMMSLSEALKDTLLEQLSELDIFLTLLRYRPGRSKLHRILGELINSKKMLPSLLQKNYLMRYNINKKLFNQCTAFKHTNVCIFQRQKIMELQSKIDNMSKINAAARTVVCCDFICPEMGKSVNQLSAGGAGASGGEAGTAADADTGKNKNNNNNEPVKYSCKNAINYNGDDVDDDFGGVGGFEIDPVESGFRLGTFLAEAGWVSESIEIFQCVNFYLEILGLNDKYPIMRIDCLQRLLQSQSLHCDFKAASRTVDSIRYLCKISDVPSSLKAIAFSQISAMYFARNEYSNSYEWCISAMSELRETTPNRITVDVLRQAAKACVVKRDFSRANMLICQAICRAKEAFGINHQKYADALLDYGFFLLNVDSIYLSVLIYKDALDVRRQIFGNRNFYVAIAHEDLSYASYVHEYSSGDFSCAQDHVDKAVDIMKDLVPSNHLMLASAKRVKALLLEEIALDKMADGMNEEGLLNQSEELHKCALQLSLEVFGEVNVQTAKHYGNLGRLYQTMNRFEEAESMHQKAIKIKTDLLGPYDYEVGLSIGHLASLYNYQMKKYRQAEDLYLRSIDISLRLFGRSYSGLEYDYLGLCHVYETLHEFEKYLRYANILEGWQLLRGQNIARNRFSYPPTREKYPIEDVKYQFFTMVIENMIDK